MALSSGVTTQTLVINEPNKYALAIGGLFTSVVNNPVPAYASQTGPYYIGGVRASLQGTLSNTSIKGVVAAISADDSINTPITFGAHIQGKSYFSDGLYVAGGASTGGFAGSFNGGLVASGFYTLSDARLKSDVRPLAPALDKLVQLQPKSYVYSGAASVLPTRKGGEMGLVAQDVEKIFPQLVKQTTVRDASGGVVGEYKAVDYASLIPVLIKGMQEQQDIIQAQQARLLQLEARVQRLSAPGQQ
ncbi:tail fiber domain-containing protein [Corallococcus terminator]